MYSDTMAVSERSVRRSVSLPPHVARRVTSLAQAKRTSANRVIADLIESALDAKEREKERFFAMAERLARSRDPQEQRRLKEELARMTFGE
jgi:metal-responsive CopG/Arc/MetJ family transcriptional regulator